MRLTPQVVVCCAAVVFSLLNQAGLFAGEKIPVSAATIAADNPTAWYDIRQIGFEGQGWHEDLKSPFDRFPGKAEATIRPAVWGLSRHSAGLCVRFSTDATTIRARWTLTSDRLAMPHMPATGVSGLDLYVKVDGKWRWLGVGQPSAVTTEATLTSGIPEGTRDYLLYLPLYNGVKSVELGVDQKFFIAQPDAYPESHRKPIVFYGTSITQGGCASRPGMVHTAILGRWLERPVINLGFSGNGRLEPEIADLLVELDPAVYVLDCLPNMSAAEVTERTAPFVRKLREKRPETPILMVEDRTYTNAFLVTSSRQRNDTSRAAFKAAYQQLTKEGVKGLGYLEGEQLLGADGEDTVDSSHPTDLGFLRQAEAMRPALESLLKK